MIHEPTLPEVLADWQNEAKAAASHGRNAHRLKKRAIRLIAEEAAQAIGGKAEIVRTTPTIKHPRGAVTLGVQNDGRIWLQGHWDGRQLYEIDALSSNFRWSSAKTIGEDLKTLVGLPTE